jgi:hypothetical protein
MTLLSDVVDENVYIKLKPIDVKAGDRKMACHYRPIRETNAPARAAQTTVPKR